MLFLNWIFDHLNLYTTKIILYKYVTKKVSVNFGSELISKDFECFSITLF